MLWKEYLSLQLVSTVARLHIIMYILALYTSCTHSKPRDYETSIVPTETTKTQTLRAPAPLSDTGPSPVWSQNQTPEAHNTINSEITDTKVKRQRRQRKKHRKNRKSTGKPRNKRHRGSDFDKGDTSPENDIIKHEIIKHEDKTILKSENPYQEIPQSKPTNPAENQDLSKSEERRKSESRGELDRNRDRVPLINKSKRIDDNIKDISKSENEQKKLLESDNSKDANVHKKKHSKSEFSIRTEKLPLNQVETNDSRSLLEILLPDKPKSKSLTKSSLQERINYLESQLLREMVRNRDLHSQLTRHTTLLEALNASVAESGRNTSQLSASVAMIQTHIKQDDEYHHSLEHKLAGVTLDVAEVNNMLKRENKGETLLQDKYIPVETPAKQVSCAVSPNTTIYRDCAEVYAAGHRTSGVYYITPLYASCSIPVYCDMVTPPGGWLVFQRRYDGSTDFNRMWQQYREGFGDVTKEFWLGNDNLFLLTNQKQYKLRVDLWDFYGSRVFADYKVFKIDGERDLYKLHASNHSGTAPDSLRQHDGMYFSTPDRDHDKYSEYNCAQEWSAGWWFSNCWLAILNGQYHNTVDVEYRGISWNDWKTEQLQRSEMKIRPVF